MAGYSANHREELLNRARELSAQGKSNASHKNYPIHNRYSNPGSREEEEAPAFSLFKVRMCIGIALFIGFLWMDMNKQSVASVDSTKVKSVISQSVDVKEVGSFLNIDGGTNSGTAEDPKNTSKQEAAKDQAADNADQTDTNKIQPPGGDVKTDTGDGQQTASPEGQPQDIPVENQNADLPAAPQSTDGAE